MELPWSFSRREAKRNSSRWRRRSLQNDQSTDSSSLYRWLKVEIRKEADLEYTEDTVPLTIRQTKHIAKKNHREF